MNEYIDVRGVYPIYFYGSKFTRLVGYSRDITVIQARILIRYGFFE